jgi:CheY-like chemotaxis protein
MSVQNPFKPDDVLACTPHGVRAGGDANSTLAPGFREVLRAINGKRTVADLQAFLKQLDPLKIAIWLDDARRMDLIKLSAPGPEAAAAAPGAAFEYGAYIEKDEEVAALARDIAKWAKLKPQSAVRARTSDLNKTVQMATLQSGEALESLAASGVFTSAGVEPDLDIMGMLAKGTASPGATPAITPPGGATTLPGAPAPVAAGGRKRSAVLADEDVPALGRLAGMLGAAGYAIRATATRKQFIDELNEVLVPDVIFLNYESTVIDTFKTIDRIRQHPTLARVPVVISGTNPSREDIAKSIMLGASGWIVRPYTDEKVRAALQGALAGMGVK